MEDGLGTEKAQRSGLESSSRKTVTHGEDFSNEVVLQGQSSKMLQTQSAFKNHQPDDRCDSNSSLPTTS